MFSITIRSFDHYDWNGTCFGFEDEAEFEEEDTETEDETEVLALGCGLLYVLIDDRWYDVCGKRFDAEAWYPLFDEPEPLEYVGYEDEPSAEYWEPEPDDEPLCQSAPEEEPEPEPELPEAQPVGRLLPEAYCL